MSWILNGYAIVYAALLVLFGRLAERHRRGTQLPGRHRAFHRRFRRMRRRHQSLDAGRLPAGAGGGRGADDADLPRPLLASYPPERRTGAVRTWTAIGGFAAALGPVAGGLLLELSWRWIFIVNVPVGVAALIIGWRKLPRSPGHDVPRPDALGRRWSPPASPP